MIDVKTQPGVVADPLASPEAAEQFWSTLPQSEPLTLQRRLCEEIARSAGWTRLDVNRFRALRHLDRRADRVLEGFLAEYGALGGQSPDIERKASLAAGELARAFGQEYERYARAAAGTGGGPTWHQRMPEIVTRLYRHREVEATLVLCRYERWPAARWQGLHETFRQVLAIGGARQPIAMRQRTDKAMVSLTPEQAYLRILLLQLLDGGRFRPDEILAVRRHVARWTATLALQPTDSGAADRGFRVDLAGTDGLTRALPAAAGATLWLDTAPVAQALDALIAERRGAASIAAGSAVDRMADLLAKLRDLYAPAHAPVPRRGERTNVAFVSVEATVGGLQSVYRTLDDEAQRARAAAAGVPTIAEEIVIGDVGETHPSSAVPPPRAADAPPLGDADETDAAYSLWQVRDRSASGSRMRGRPGGRAPKPGFLMAFRDDKYAPWTIAVVRRLNRVTGTLVELGVEYLGHDPQACVLAAGSAPAEGTASEARSDRIAAIFLPPNAANARRPVASLLLPACEFAAGRTLTLVTAMDETVIRLKTALERDTDYVWTTFEPLAAA